MITSVESYVSNGKKKVYTFSIISMLMAVIAGVIPPSSSETHYIIGDILAGATGKNDVRVSAGVEDPLVVCRLWEGLTLTSNLHRLSDLYLNIGMLNGGRAKLNGRSMCRYAKAD
jgi:hypothetical protein